jgi:phytoene dehydrogenase-like protein
VGRLDAVVLGSGPNGLAAALTLARAGLEVEVVEGATAPGGGCRTEELTLPGFLHDVCSAVHPLAAASPFFRSVDLAGRGVKLCSPQVAFAHPLDGGRAAAALPSLSDTAASLGADSDAYLRLFAPLVRHSDPIIGTVLGSLRSLPGRPVALARFGLLGVQSANLLTRRFESDEARALLGGAAAHSTLRLSTPLSGAFGLLLTLLAHSVGWPLVEGGSAGIVRALVDELESLGGRVSTGRPIADLRELPAAEITMLDVTPRQLVALAGDRLPPRYLRALRRFRYGPGIFKVDWALSGPVPWSADACRTAGTVHAGGPIGEVAASEAEVSAGRHPEKPFCLVVQPAVVDATRAPNGRQTLWAYCHVPAGSTVDMTARIEDQIERFAPGFRDLVLARTTADTRQVEEHNPNYVGGDISAGAPTLRQTVFRPVPRWNPYRVPLGRVYLCSASTPPGGGVHGMCGLNAANSALAELRRRRPTAAGGIVSSG